MAVKRKGRMSKGFEKAGLVVYVITGILALGVYLLCAIFLFPFGIVIGFIPLLIILWLGATFGTLLRPSTYKKARKA